MSDWQTFSHLLRLMRPFRWRVALSILLGALTIGASVGLMTLAAWVIATAALRPSVAELGVAIVGVRFFGITRGLFRYLERLISHDVTFRLLAQLRMQFYQKLEPLAPARLMHHRSGDLLARIVGDINTLENVFLRVIAPSLTALVVAVFMFVFMALHDLRLAFSLIAFLTLAGIGVPLLTQHLGRDVGQCMIQTRAGLTTTIVDGVQGLADLVAYGAHEHHTAHIDALNREYQDQQTRMARIDGLQTALMTLVTSLALIATLVITISLVENGTYSGVILAVLALGTLAAFEAVQPLPAAFQHWDANLAAAHRLFEITAVDHAIEHRLPAERLAAAGLAITNLRFQYSPDDPPALDGVSLVLPPGTTIAVVGASGAGKSTLVNLLLRFWDDYDGAITLETGDRQLDHRTLSADSVRALFSVVSQHTHLFNGTISDNLRLADLQASDDDLIRACTSAQIHAFIESLPEGYATQVGEQGLLLSGGERQRLSIARALLKDAPFLLLDEPTSNLDAVTACAILATIFEAFPDRATLLITHRLSGLDRVTSILVLDGGRVVEQGAHGELLAREGYYHRLWAQQHDLLPGADSVIIDG